MQISDRSDFEIKNFAHWQKNKVDVIYFADSTGSLDRENKNFSLFKIFGTVIWAFILMIIWIRQWRMQ